MWGSTKRCHSLFLEVPLDWRSGFESISILLRSIFLNESTWSRSSWKCFLQITTSKLSILATEVSYIWRLFFARLDVEIDRLPWSLGPWLIKLTQPMPSTQADQGDCSVVSMSTPGPGVSEVLVGWVGRNSWTSGIVAGSFRTECFATWETPEMPLNDIECCQGAQKEI